MCTDFLRIIRVIFFERNNKILKRSIIEYIYMYKYKKNLVEEEINIIIFHCFKLQR